MVKNTQDRKIIHLLNPQNAGESGQAQNLRIMIFLE